MTITGVGTDVVDVGRLAAVLARRPAVAERVFTPGERRSDLPGLAARFAAKEAVAKALGAPGGVRWHDVEVRRGAAGRPVLSLTGTARDVADRQGVDAWHVSLSHDAGVAVAFVVAVGQAPSRTASRPPNVDT